MDLLSGSAGVVVRIRDMDLLSGSAGVLQLKPSLSDLLTVGSISSKYLFYPT
ncbi:hypothetical protein HanPSC8_Chr12g0504841 [Helianthus annuus]|nr:hypothetical protein HanPSC8_Chr12g0504841 [Helianthus annuus]